MEPSKLERICETALEAVGYELVDLDFSQSPHGWVLRIFIDHPQIQAKGREDNDEPAARRGTIPACTINHQDCEDASRHLGTVLDVEDPIEGAYRLEVSSPGVRRPLRKAKDFQRFVGHRARVVLCEQLNGRRKFLGELLEATEDVVVIEVDGESFRLPLAEIKKARLEVEFKGEL